MGAKIQKDANAQGASNVAENVNVNVKPSVVVSATPKPEETVKTEETVNTEVNQVVEATTPKEPKERKYRGILPNENDEKHFEYKVGDRVSYIVTLGGQRVYGWVTNLRTVPKNGRSAAVVQIDLGQPVSYKRLEVYTTRLTKEDSKPNPFVKKQEEPKTAEVVIAEIPQFLVLLVF